MSESRETALGRFHRIATVGAISVLLLALGVYLGVAKHQTLTVSFNGAWSILNAGEDYKSWWQPVRYQGTGVVRHDRSRAGTGVTFYVSAGRQDAYLIDMNGAVLHRWSFPLKAVAVPVEARAKVVPDPDTHWDGAHLYPNGDVLAIYRRKGEYAGMVRINRRSELLWYSSLHHHHAPTVGPEGRIYSLTDQVRHRRVPQLEVLDPPILENFVTIMRPNGEVIRSISLIDAFVGTDYAEYLRLARNLRDGDSFHANKVEVILPGLEHRAPFLKPGNLMLSFREIHTIAILDPTTEKIVWAAKGPWFFQHDPELLANGNILLFDKRGAPSQTGGSRVLETNPVTFAVEWSYAGSRARPLYSFVRSGNQRLPNGNTLVIESDGGRILEVTRGGDIVWEFINPDRKTIGVERVSVIGLNATRFAREDLPFLRENRAAAR